MGESDRSYWCFACGARFRYRYSSRLGQDLGTDSVRYHQKVTGHSQQRHPLLVDRQDFSVKGATSGRLTALYREPDTGHYLARCSCGRRVGVTGERWGIAEHCDAPYETLLRDVRHFV